MLRRAALLAIFLTAPVVSVAARPDPGTSDAVIAKLDLTSFPNSVGPRRATGKRSFADYGFTDIGMTKSGADLYQQGGGWMMGFAVLSESADAIQLCFVDRGLKRPQDSRGPSYNARSALVVTRGRGRFWSAHRVRDGLPGCSNDPVMAD